MSLLSLPDDVVALRAPSLWAFHCIMYRSVHQHAIRVGELLKKAARGLPRKPNFSRRRKEATDELSVKMAITKFHDVVEHLRAFQDAWTKTNNLVFRLARVRYMFSELEEIGESLDGLVKAAALNVDEWKDEERSWRKQLQAGREQEELEMSEQAAKKELPFARRWRPHEPMEALTLLKFEIDNFRADNTKVHVNSMKKVFFSVVCSSNGRVAKPPAWYIPPYALSFAREKGVEGSVGESYRGVWVHRKSIGAELKGGEQRVVSRDVVVTQLKFRVDAHEVDFWFMDAIRRFSHEVDIWFNLQHDNILKLHGASHCSSPAMLVTEEASKRPLVSYVRRSNLQHSVSNLFYEAALGLQYLHEHKIAHGNLKSNNILVTADEHVKLTNFGPGMLLLQNLRVQDEVVEQRRQAEYHRKLCQGLPVTKQYSFHVEPFKDMGWRAPNVRAKKQYGRPTFQDDVYSLGLCMLDALVPGELCSFSLKRNGISRVGDVDFDPLDSELRDTLTKLYQAYADNLLPLVASMCSLDPDERPPIADVISQIRRSIPPFAPFPSSGKQPYQANWLHQRL